MSFADVPHGLQRVAANQTLPRHRHAGAYVALVLRGGYEEAGCCGRWRVESGDILLHSEFEGHCDRFGAAGAEILNLPLPLAWPMDIAFARCRGVEGIVDCARKDTKEALLRLFNVCTPAVPTPLDWPDMLVADLWSGCAFSLSEWAVHHGLSAETLSRGVRRLFGVTPACLRREIHVHKAWRGIVHNATPLAMIAAETGFADQAHMSREVARLTGHSPGYWRRQIPSRQAN